MSLHAADLETPPQIYDNERESRNEVSDGREVARFCYAQRNICRKICYLRFRDDFVGCHQTCDSRESRCTRSSCYRWNGSEFLIAERFGGTKCL